MRFELAHDPALITTHGKLEYFLVMPKARSQIGFLRMPGSTSEEPEVVSGAP